MKLKKLMVSGLLAAVMTPVTAHAAKTNLVYVSANTYVTSDHADDYFADIYYGEVSVRGADRFTVGKEICYPKWTRITYNVQGKVTTLQTDSNGMNDTVTRKKNVTVRDEWNNGLKTQVYGNYGYGNTGYIINQSPEEQN